MAVHQFSLVEPTSHPKVFLPLFRLNSAVSLSKMIPAVETVEHCKNQASVHPDCTTTADPEHIDRSTSDWNFEPIARAVQMPTVYRDEDGRVVVIDPPATPIVDSFIYYIMIRAYVFLLLY